MPKALTQASGGDATVKECGERFAPSGSNGRWDVRRKDSLTHPVRPTRESSSRVFLPVVRLDEVPLATGFLLGAAFLESAALAFLAAVVPPEVIGRVRPDGVCGRLATTLRTPGPGMRLVSSPVSHRTVIMAPLTAVTTPGRGTPLRCHCDPIANVCHLCLLNGAGNAPF
jgi:hypothetical protein